MKLPWVLISMLRSCRPPRGGRGLKFIQLVLLDVAQVVAPLAGGVD